MHNRSDCIRVSTLAVAMAMAMAAGPVALADPADEAPSRPTGTRPDQIAPAMKPQGTPGGGAGTATPKVDTGKTSFLPRAGANSTPAGPGVGVSRNPYHPQTVEMLRQSNRLKAGGYLSNVMNDGEIVLALNATIKLLAKVGDEQQGHRTRATQDIEDAIKQIKTKAGKAGAKQATPPRDGSKPTIPRAESDLHLREARKSLEKVVYQINHGGNLKRLVPARASVQRAIQELSTALEAR